MTKIRAIKYTGDNSTDIMWFFCNNTGAIAEVDVKTNNIQYEIGRNKKGKIKIGDYVVKVNNKTLVTSSKEYVDLLKLLA